MMEPVQMDVHKDSRLESDNHCSAQEYERHIPGGNAMSCERCGGLMVIETICELMEAGSRSGIDTTRCLNCGNFEDTIIRANRGMSRLPSQTNPYTVGARGQSVVQPPVLERAIQTHGVIPKYLRSRAPRLPVGVPSSETWTLEPSRIELEHS